MMTLYTANQNHEERRLELPMPPEELVQQIDAIRGAGGVLCISRIDSPVPDIGRHFRGLTAASDTALQKLNRLAETMDKMSLVERFHLSKALPLFFPQGLDTVLQTAAHIKAAAPDCYEVLPGITKSRQLGEWLLTQNRMDEDTVKRLRPHLNIESIGQEYLLTHKGSFLPEGYVGLQDGLEPFDILRLTLASASGGEVQLSLPASSEQLEQAKRELEVDDLSQATISEVKFSIFYSYLEELLPLDGITAAEANGLAEYLRDTEELNPVKFRAALEAERPDTFSDALSIVKRIEDYTFIPQDPAEYAKEKIRLAGADQEVFRIIEGYTDFERLGGDIMKAEGVRQTECGPLRRISEPFPVEPCQTLQDAASRALPLSLKACIRHQAKLMALLEAYKRPMRESPLDPEGPAQSSPTPEELPQKDAAARPQQEQGPWMGGMT